ncbi:MULTISPECIES: UbiX family flavin prenyltransferase [Vibrio]|uniref:Flavin prenyltransferase UbiX n=2 Tax=Vibrio TaxID=662 RepID=A0A7X4LLR3_9VIBR|nr:MULTISPECIES: UbiX family flavin prenyltransferase [Vibrio]MBF9000256.1 UbiX family flavin prenyltransferase [Vibrio nitrifigilis]MZI94277.1 UbiX family flavin prenyltransferase [Vibrio eleionomae]
MTKDRLVIGISGASGFMYGFRALQMASSLGIETHVVMSPAADLTREHETDISASAIQDLADVVHPIDAVGASIASGSFKTLGMLVAPCSMHTLAAIANGVTDNLLTRAADVALKERRRLVLMARETPLHAGHIRNMQWVTESGGIVFPPVPALYAKPQSVEEIIDHSVSRALGMFGIECEQMPRWGETISLDNDGRE